MSVCYAAYAGEVHGSYGRHLFNHLAADRTGLFAFENGNSGDILVQKAPACTIGVLAQAVKEIFQLKEKTKIIGIRHGGKNI